MRQIPCPACGAGVPIPFPLVAVDCIVQDSRGRVLLVRRLHPPPGWALPGGFVEPDETLEQAVARELLEETGLSLSDARQLHAYSGPGRDPRHPMVSVVFTGRATGTPVAASDAAATAYFALDALPSDIAFDHRAILADFARRQPC